MHKNIPCLQIGSGRRCHLDNSFPSALTAGWRPRRHREIRGFSGNRIIPLCWSGRRSGAGGESAAWLAGNSLGAQLATCSVLSCWHFALTFRGIPSLESSLYFSYVLFFKFFYSRIETFLDPDTFLKAAVGMGGRALLWAGTRSWVWVASCSLSVLQAWQPLLTRTLCGAGSCSPARQPGRIAVLTSDTAVTAAARLGLCNISPEHCSSSSLELYTCQWPRGVQE